MKLYINEKIISFHNRYYIKDETGKDILEISSKPISIGTKTWIKDLEGNNIVYIEQELFHLMPKYNVIINDKIEYSINKKFHLLKNDYILSNNYRIEGNFLSHNFTVYNNKNKKVGEIYRKYLSIGDQYIIDIIDENDYILILSIIVAISNDIDRSQRSMATSNSN
jgi:uncharacterized protein YxjI